MMNMRFPFILNSKWEELKKHLKLLFKKGLFSLLLQKPLFLSLALFLGLIPTIALYFSFQEKKRELCALSTQVAHIPIKIAQVIEKEQERNAFFQNHQKADPKYVENTFENITFLSREIKALKYLKQLPTFRTCENLNNRLTYLIGENRCLFTLSNENVSKRILEREWKQDHLIELSRDDLKELLMKIENAPPSSRPQLTVSSFHLQRKEGKESYLLELELIERLKHQDDKEPS